jgi:hypothetical protein
VTTAAGPCGVITRSEAGGALGIDPGPPIPFQNGCKYGQDTDPKTLRVTVGTGAQSTRAFDSLRKGEQQKATDGSVAYKDLPGVGDAAFLSLGATSGVVFILKGSTLAQIAVGGFDTSKSPEQILVTLANDAAPRL